MDSNIKFKIDFGTIGLAIGDEIINIDGKTKTKVSSGGGGTLVSLDGYIEEGEEHSICPLTYFTKQILKQPIVSNNDVFSMWFFKGKTLLEIHNERNC